MLLRGGAVLVCQSEEWRAELGESSGNQLLVGSNLITVPPHSTGCFAL